MSENCNPVANLAEKYDNPYIKTLIAFALDFVPVKGMGALLVLLDEEATKIKADRLRTFFDELEKGSILLTEELIRTEDFLHKYHASLRAAANTRQREKIKMFARLFNSSLKDAALASFDEYEDLLKILDDLSYRELVVLKILDKHESTQTIRPYLNPNDLSIVMKNWDDLMIKICSELRIVDYEAKGILSRLNRSGCYTTATGSFISYTGDMGYLTALYYRLKKYLLEQPPTSP